MNFIAKMLKNSVFDDHKCNSKMRTVDKHTISLGNHRYHMLEWLKYIAFLLFLERNFNKNLMNFLEQESVNKIKIV
jgi:hypothetical protein